MAERFCLRVRRLRRTIQPAGPGTAPAPAMGAGYSVTPVFVNNPIRLSLRRSAVPSQNVSLLVFGGEQWGQIATTGRHDQLGPKVSTPVHSKESMTETIFF